MSRVVVIDDHVTPYRIPIYEQLARRVDSLQVFFCSQPLRYQEFDPPPLEFPHQVLPHKVVRLRRPPFGEPRYILITPTLLPQVIRAVPTVVVGYAFSVPAWTALLGARLRRAGYICWSTDTLYTERHMGPGQRLSRKLLIGAADAYMTPSSAGRDKFLAYGAEPERVFKVPQRTLMEPLPARAADGPTCTFLFVGSLSERKGVDALLDAFQLVAAELPGARLLLVGEGPKGDELKQEAAVKGITNRVEFAGFVQPDRLPRVYQQADVFVFPSREDTFGVAIADAAAAGLPILGSRYAGASSDFVQAGVNGFEIDPSRSEHMARTMIHLARRPALRASMGEASRDLSERSSVEAATEQFLAAIRMAANR